MGILDFLKPEPKSLPQLQIELSKLDKNIEQKRKELTAKGFSQNEIQTSLQPLREKRTALIQQIKEMNVSINAKIDIRIAQVEKMIAEDKERYSKAFREGNSRTVLAAINRGITKLKTELEELKGKKSE